MSATIIPLVRDYIHEYIAEWNVEILDVKKDLHEKTPVFSPTPQFDSKFHLEIRRKPHGDIDFILVKAPGTANNPSLKMKMELRVIDMRGKCLKYYGPSTTVSVPNLTEFTFSEATHPCSLIGIDRFLVSCRLVFFEFSLIIPMLCKKDKWNYNDSVICKPSALGDVEFKFNRPSSTIAAHRDLLQERAPNFFKTCILDKQDKSTPFSPIDVSFFETSFECFLNYLYCGKIKDKSWETVKILYTFAHGYEVEDLKRDCSSILGSYMSVANICDILKLANDFEDDDLKQKAIAFAADHVKELLETKNWKALALENSWIAYNVMLISFSKK